VGVELWKEDGHCRHADADKSDGLYHSRISNSKSSRRFGANLRLFLEDGPEDLQIRPEGRLGWTVSERSPVNFTALEGTARKVLYL
jgi:hypothetical protein